MGNMVLERSERQTSKCSGYIWSLIIFLILCIVYPHTYTHKECVHLHTSAFGSQKSKLGILYHSHLCLRGRASLWTWNTPSQLDRLTKNLGICLSPFPNTGITGMYYCVQLLCGCWRPSCHEAGTYWPLLWLEVLPNGSLRNPEMLLFPLHLSLSSPSKGCLVP